MAGLEVDRPNKLRVRVHSSRSEREIIYDGKQVTLYTPAQKYYSTVEFTGNLGELIGRLEEKYAVQMPLADMFLWGTPAASFDKIESAKTSVIITPFAKPRSTGRSGSRPGPSRCHASS
jgi:hypothetical protein